MNTVTMKFGKSIKPRLPGGAVQALEVHAIQQVEETPVAPLVLRLFRYGENASEKGVFVFNEVSAESVIAEYLAHGKALCFDYNHGMAYDNPTHEQAVAAGEFTPGVVLDEAGKPELWAVDVKWTERARAFIEGHEYKFFSPLFEHQDGVVMRLINCALTNLPALNDLNTLMAASITASAEETQMLPEKEAEKEELKAALCIKEEELKALRAKLEAMEDEEEPEKIAAALSATRAGRTVTSLAAFRRQLLDVTGKSSDAAALGQVIGWKQDAAEVATVRADAEKREQASLSAKFEEVFVTAQKDGKLPPAEVEATKAKVLGLSKSLSGKDGITVGAVELATEMLSSRGKVVADPVGAGGGGHGTTLSAFQLKAAAALGVKPEMVAKYKAEQLTR